MSACIIPVAPNFQDPPNQPDSVPYLQVLSGTPAFNSIYPLTGPSTTFFVNVTDPDPGATLYYEWVFDYPQSALGTPQLANANNAGLSPPARLFQDVSCQRVVATQSTTHQLELFVANGPFDDGAPAFGTPTDPRTMVVSDGWTIQFQMACGQ